MFKSKMKGKFKILNITRLNQIIAGSRHWNFTVVKLSIPAPYLILFYHELKFEFVKRKGNMVWISPLTIHFTE